MISKTEIRVWTAVILTSFFFSLMIRVFFKYSFISSLRAFFGFIYVLFLPGYIIVRCFFNELVWIEKAALSFGLSLALIILSVMFTNMILKIPITSLTNFVIILIVIVVTILIKITDLPSKIIFRKESKFN
jgi:uncharacterized membrane protein